MLLNAAIMLYAVWACFVCWTLEDIMLYAGWVYFVCFVCWNLEDIFNKKKL